MQHIGAFNFATWPFARRIPILNSAVAIQIQIDPRRQQKVQSNHSAANSQNLCKGIPTQQHCRNHGLPELKGRHILVGAVMDNVINGEISSVLSPAISTPLIDP